MKSLSKTTKTLIIFVLISCLVFIISTVIFVVSRNANAKLITRYNNLYLEAQAFVQQVTKLPKVYIGDVTARSQVLELVILTEKADNRYLEQVKVADKLQKSPLTRLLPFYQKKYNAIRELSIQEHNELIAHANYYNEASKIDYNEEKLLLLNKNILEQTKMVGEKASINEKLGPTPPVISAIINTPIALLIIATTILLGAFSVFGGFFLGYRAFMQRKFLLVGTWFIFSAVPIFFFYLLFIAMTSSFY